MNIKERTAKVLEIFDREYGAYDKCYLNYGQPYELMIATILSAQCTDDRVNIITKGLFQKYKSADDFADADISELEKDIYSAGFYKNKAKNIIGACKMLRDEYNYDMPSDIDKLTKLPGVGRKTANVIRSHVFNIPSIVVDTHVKRISKKLGLTENDDPAKVEKDLMKLFPQEHWIRYNTQAIAHGRKICKSPNPKCSICCFALCCKEYEKQQCINN